MLDLSVQRNGYGRQIDSFEIDLTVDEIGSEPIRAVFIRAPMVEKAGADVEVLAAIDDSPVLCRQGNGSGHLVPSRTHRGHAAPPAVSGHDQVLSSW